MTPLSPSLSDIDKRTIRNLFKIAIVFLVCFMAGCSSDKPVEESKSRPVGKSKVWGKIPAPPISIEPFESFEITVPKSTETSIDLSKIRLPEFTKQAVPSSIRSRDAVTRVAPRLIVDLEARQLSYGAPIFIRIFKKERQLEVWVKGKERFEHFRTYRIAAFSGGLGPKLQRGDHQAPEGFYYVGSSHMNPYSKFHLSFNLGYPNAYDRALGRTGSAIMVHGSFVSIGCFAMTDRIVEEIYTLADAALRNGQRFFRVHIFPFRMTEENLKRHRNSKWFSFWKNLKEGNDFFEKTGAPPNVLVENNKYIFEVAKGG